MARITDPQKIENVKRAAMEIIVEYGYRGASIDAIAKKAKVSSGYLYRYYNSKDDLMEDVFNTAFDKFRNSIAASLIPSNTIYEFAYNLVDMVFKLAKEDSIYAQMLSTIVLDADFEKTMSEEDKTFKDKTLEKILSLGKGTGEISEHTTEEDIMLIFMTIPFRYVLLKLKEDNHEDFFQTQYVARIAKICFNALK